ncbi:reprolysin-like metallopeptidase [Flavobacterium nackdongense]|uniref:T9SS sorting signal type C domain-containing protein n=1 Tax=Flavobacterium nackdongense TaxID=2547394 RepID=A0A4P6Y7F5_9FLAO|nr:M12 family metallo-peptidase [Flavobacterium nackdongense]QBN18559.1 T9SS sorting signal type C domain-containing protein [Flavobacterium nackdongense]
MKRITYLSLLLIIIIFQFSAAQSINNWTLKNTSETSKARVKIDPKNIPSKYQILTLDFKSLKSNFKKATINTTGKKTNTPLLMDFPKEDGTMETFSVEKISVLHPDLEAKYPEIQSFYGVSTKNELNKIYISISPSGFNGLITGEKSIYIDPIERNNTIDYIVYNKKDYTKNRQDVFTCGADMPTDVMPELSKAKTTSTAKTTNVIDGKIRTYRLAVACTSEYTAYYGNTVAGALAAINTTITRVNSVFKTDLGIQFQVVSGNDRLIYRNNVNIDASPDPDPYDNYDGSQMLGANTANITGLLGVGAYDIGHAFSTGGGGIASLSVPCAASTKGQGVTGIVTPQFDQFDIGYVAHEMGHQFGATHTQSNSCQNSAASSMEPGSGTTIMSYAGICPPNIQADADAYFHAYSIQQMTVTVNANTCEVETLTGNNEPVITAVPDRTIPKSTPFILTGIATDTDAGDAARLTYCWEQMDAASSGNVAPVSTSTTKPTFRSIIPTLSPARTFPNLNDIISNTTPTWEVLPSVGRTLNFRLTVRDNNPIGGQTNQDNVAVTVGTAGPFIVTAPNTSVIWYVGTSQTVTWNVASTNTATYSVNVNIKLSTDGGLTYPITLLSNTPNDGTQAITVPNNIGKNNRIKVEAAANIFFDISNANFEIKANTFDLTSTQPTVSVCKPSNAVYTLNYTPAPGFAETTTFSAVGLPVGAIATFVPTTRSTAGTVTMTVSGIANVATGSYSFNANGTSTNANINLPLTLKVFDNNIANVTLTSPTNGAANQQTSVLLQWGAIASASSYIVEVAASPTFAAILETATVTTNSYQTASLTSGTINYWRVRPLNSCVTGANSETFVFQIASDFCKTYTNKYYENNDFTWELNSTNAVSARMDVPDNIIVSKVSFYVKATHASLADIKMQFSGPTGIFAEIYNRDCTGANIDVHFDDAGTTAPTCSGTTPAMSGTQQASQSLSKFNGTSSLGTWVLLATDRGANTSGGTFTDFQVSICGKLQIVNNITLANNSLSVVQGASASITQAQLGATQPAATTAQLIYTVTKLPINGILKRNNIAMAVGGTFTQADLNNNLISYTNNGTNANPDSFKFSISGINLALLGGQTYNISVSALICTAPTPNVSNLPDVNAQCSVTPAVPAATSNCYGTITATTATVFPITTQGTTVVTWTYNDGHGNTSVQTQNIIVNNTMSAAIAGTASVCSGTNSNIQVTIIGGVSPYTVVYTNGTSNFTVSNYTSGSAIIVAPTLTTTYTLVSVTSAEGCLSPTNSGSAVLSIDSTTWNGSAWSNGAPTGTKSVLISGDYSQATNINACSLTVNNNAVVSIPSGYNVTLNGALTVSSGSFTLNNNANLIQTSNVANSGNIIVKRNSSALMRLDYTAWSSPVTNNASLFLQSFSPATTVNRFYGYDTSTNLYTAIASPSTTNFALGKGYLIRMPNTHPTTPTIWNGSFIGVPNNGVIPFTMTNGGVGKRFNLVGNPYPSPISMTQFVADNNTKITGTLYFWRKTNGLSNPTYSTWTNGVFASNGGAQVVDPLGIIQTGQGFFVEALNSSTSVTFNNGQRIANNANQFFKTKEIERSTIWLNATSATGNFSQMAVSYTTNATQGVDEYDGKYYNDGAIALNSILDNSDYVIQGRALPFDGSDEVPLSFTAANAGEYSISIDHVDGLFAGNQDIILNDSETGTETDLKTGSYTFTAAAGQSNTRFTLKYQKTLGINAQVFDENSIVVFKNNGSIHIKSNNTAIDNVQLFDVRGRLMIEKSKVNSNETSIESARFANEVLIVKITSADKKVVNKKIAN